MAVQTTRVHSERRQKTQVGAETVAGTGVGDSKWLQMYDIMLQSDGEFESFKPKGSKFVTSLTPTTKSSKGNLEGKGDYNGLIYPLASLCGKATPASLGSGAYQWDFIPVVDGPDDPQTFTVGNGDNWAARKAAFMLMAGLEMEFNRGSGGITTKGDLIGFSLGEGHTLGVNTIFHSVLVGTDTTTTFTYDVLGAFGSSQTTSPITLASTDQSAAIQAALEAKSNVGAGNVRVTQTANHAYDIEFLGQKGQKVYAVTTDFAGAATSGSSPSNTITRPQTGVVPTTIPQKPILAKQWYVQVVSAYADFATEPGLEHVMKFGWKMTDKYTHFYAANTDTTVDDTDPTGITEDDPKTEIMLLVGSGNPIKDDLIAAADAGETRLIRVTALGPTIGGGYRHTFQATFAGKVNKPYEIQDADGNLLAHAFTFEIAVSEDGDWLDKGAQFTVINTRSAL